MTTSLLQREASGRGLIHCCLLIANNPKSKVQVIVRCPQMSSQMNHISNHRSGLQTSLEGSLMSFTQLSTGLCVALSPTTVS
ncbi:hypothetical protein AMELA_G00199700 [Ameiurus melas]|uniref:Uncharacterized protein n=1 Tax=Ameiurus melas TaxID=219545 RepID=A0A7J6A913_AMEME|nr:hypothetical protein AMELA_G00199700 [Ameiurus melas]